MVASSFVVPAVGRTRHRANAAGLGDAEGLAQPRRGADAVEAGGIDVDAVGRGVQQAVGKEDEAARVRQGDVRDAKGRFLPQQQFVTIRRGIVEAGVAIVVDEHDPAAGEPAGARGGQTSRGTVGSHPAHDDWTRASDGFSACGTERAGQRVDGIGGAPLTDEARHRGSGNADQDCQDGERDEQFYGRQAALAALKVEAIRAHKPSDALEGESLDEALPIR